MDLVLWAGIRNFKRRWPERRNWGHACAQTRLEPLALHRRDTSSMPCVYDETVDVIRVENVRLAVGHTAIRGEERRKDGTACVKSRENLAPLC